MEIRFAVMADAANVSREGKVNITGIFDRINAQEFPAVHMGGYLVLGIEAHAAEAGRHKVRILFVDADGNLLMEMNGGLVVLEPEDRSTPVRGNEIIQTQMIPLPASGEYSFDIFIDDRYEASIPVTAREIG